MMLVMFSEGQGAGLPVAPSRRARRCKHGDLQGGSHNPRLCDPAAPERLRRAGAATSPSAAALARCWFGVVLRRSSSSAA